MFNRKWGILSLTYQLIFSNTFSPLGLEVWPIGFDGSPGEAGCIRAETIDYSN